MPIRSIVLTSLFAALIAVGAYLAIPLAPVPITFQTLCIIIAGLLGGKRIGLSAVGIYLIAGAIGLPVFSGGTGGIAHLIGPTGGFLFGSLLSVFLAGFFSDQAKKLLHKEESMTDDDPEKDHLSRSVMVLLIAGTLTATIAMYLSGIPWLKLSVGLTWEKTFAVGMIPFIPGDLLKAAAAIALAKIFIKRIDLFLS